MHINIDLVLAAGIQDVVKDYLHKILAALNANSKLSKNIQEP